jgi:hypothetical protein
MPVTHVDPPADHNSPFLATIICPLRFLPTKQPQQKIKKTKRKETNKEKEKKKKKDKATCPCA